MYLAWCIIEKYFFCLGDEETTSTASKTENEQTTTTMAIAPVKKKDDGWWNYIFGSSEGIQTIHTYIMSFVFNFSNLEWNKPAVLVYHCNSIKSLAYFCCAVTQSDDSFVICHVITQSDNCFVVCLILPQSDKCVCSLPDITCSSSALSTYVIC